MKTLRIDREICKSAKPAAYNNSDMASIIYPTNWQDYELLDTGVGCRLERYGKYRLIRPDPTVTWEPTLPITQWEQYDARFILGQRELGAWEIRNKKLPNSWNLQWRSLTFSTKLTPAKHTGVFPEHAVQWGWMQEQIAQVKQQGASVKVLNLFGYTGLASLACAAVGAEVTHIESSYSTLGWARENQADSGLSEAPIRWIREDVQKFVEREVKRGNRYHGIVLDPPAYGHGPKGEIWSASKMLPDLFSQLAKILNPDPLFVLLNSYATDTRLSDLESMVRTKLCDLGGVVHSGHLALQQSSNDRLLTTGSWVVWEQTPTL